MKWNDGFSRRDFLQLCGVTAAGLALPRFGSRRRFHGRAFQQTAVRSAPREGAAAVRSLAPDAVIPLAEASAGWFETAGGYVAAREVQPVVPYARPEVLAQMPDAPFWAEVVAPVAAMRRWPLPDAPVVGRPGYGAVFEIGDIQTDDRGTIWYRALGPGAWLQGLHLRRVQPERAPMPRIETLSVDLSSCRLEAYVGGKAALRAPVSPPEGCAIPSQTARVAAKRPAAALAGRPGAPWILALSGGVVLHGAYWHNCFGTPHGEAAGCISLAPAAARWVYDRIEIGQARAIFQGGANG